MGNAEEKDLSADEQWKVFSHPLRLGILKALGRGRMLTNEELAATVGVASGKLYFHTKKLLEAGLIEPAGTRQKGPITEKLYRATARRFAPPPLKKNEDTPALLPLLSAALDLYQNAWLETEGLKEETELGAHLVLPHNPERRREFIERLLALMKDFQNSSDAETPGARATAIAFLLFTFPTELNEEPK
jgi:DNA-binding transcriptional ArsR family regulator